MTKVFIRQQSDGQLRVYHDKQKWADHSEYMWSVGNYGCDCNRGIFFGHDHDVGCGESKFAVRIEDDNGKLLYQDERWEAA